MPVTQPEKGHFGIIVPLATSAATLGMALYQIPLYRSFMNAQPSIAGRPLSAFWEAQFGTTAPMIVTGAIASAISGFASARWLRTHTTLETTNVSNWYLTGACFALAHTLFTPFSYRLINTIVNTGGKAAAKTDQQVESENKETFNKWILMHTARILTTDLPALVCFAEGVALSLWVI